jgi:DNA-binding response OmpR family regulator
MKRKLLLADDSATIHKVVGLILSDEGFEIRSVLNGGDAWSLIKEFMPDIVLADAEMPLMDGYQLCEKIKRDDKTEHIPVLILTSTFNPVAVEEARGTGADGYISKPFESQELINKIKALLGESGAVNRPAEEPGRIESAMKPEHEAGRSTEETGLSEAGMTGTEPVDEESSDTYHQRLELYLKEVADSDSFRKMITDSIENILKSYIKSIMKDEVSDYLEKTVREMLDEMAPQLKKIAERAIWETVPDIAEAIIMREIEKIKASY